MRTATTVPSGNAKAAMALFRLSLFSGDPAHAEASEAALAQVGAMLGKYPSAFGEWLNLLSFQHGRPRELALVGTPGGVEALRAVADRGFRPNLVIAAGPDGSATRVPLLADRRAPEGGAAAFLCDRFTCIAPVAEPAALEALLGAS